MDSFNAIVAEEIDGKSRGVARRITLAGHNEGDVTVRVDYSTLNYKDGLVLTGRGKVVRRFPLVAGIDLAGTVTDSSHPAWRAGDRVLVNGFGLSERHHGGYAQQARVRGDWLVRVPDAFTTRQAMAIGTAGYTAMLCVMALEQAGVKPGEREILVTGAAGGVGSVAVVLLARLGHTVAASTGRPETHGYLRDLGATTLIDRAELARQGPALAGERWAGAIDSVGSQTLATILSQTAYGGAVAACGLAGGMDLPATVAPFILRNVSLLGVDSVMAPQAKRQAAWARLARDLDPAKLDAMTGVVPMSGLLDLAPAILSGQVRGRVVVDVNA